MTKIDIAMTAVIRPSILNETLNTIIKNVCKGNTERFTLIINVDPIGEKIKPMKVVRLAKKKFENVIYNIPKRPSFPKAVKWVWSQTTAPFVFHWEDDVNILRPINIDKMINILNEFDDLSSLRLYKAKTPKRKSFSTFGCRWIYNKKGFYIAKDWKKQFGLNPILIKQEFISEAVPLLKDEYNPEKQFRYSKSYMRPLIRKWKYGLFTNPGEARLVDGRKGQRWKNSLKLDKPVGRTFTEWERK